MQTYYQVIYTGQDCNRFLYAAGSRSGRKISLNLTFAAGVGKQLQDNAQCRPPP
jgi:hypothetical protein